MKLTKRIKKWIIQSMIFWCAFFIIILLTFFIFAYPNIVEIQEKKQELSQVYDEYNEIIISWLPYSDFKSQIMDKNASNYTKELLKNISEDFYNTHFIHTWSEEYDFFLTSIEQKIAEMKSSDAYLEKDKNLNTILPTYNSNNTSWESVFSDVWSQQDFSENETLTDFYFIHYIENLLYSFNLSYQWDIGVWNIMNIDQEEMNDEDVQRDLLQENIYAIPLSFSIVWRKSDIVDFLHYFENVAVIEISDEGFKVPNDGFIQKRIEGSVQTGVYNIYENQLADIVSLNIREYPNSSVKTTPSLVYAMKTLQWKEKFELDVDLQFYVAGVPGYKMQSYINNFIEQYTKFSAILKKDTQTFLKQKYKYSTSNQLTAIQTLQNLEMLSSALEKDIATLKKDSIQGKNIEKTYNTASQYNRQLEKIKSSYDEQMKILIK